MITQLPEHRQEKYSSKRSGETLRSTRVKRELGAGGHGALAFPPSSVSLLRASCGYPSASLSLSSAD